jgi:hypothetical protein
MAVAVRSVVITVDRQHAMHSDASSVGGDKDDRLLAVWILL